MKKSLWEKDSFIKVFSVLLALVLWFFVGFQNPEIETTIKDVKINVKMPQTVGEKGTLDIVGNGNFSVDLTVSGKRSVLRSASEASFSAYVNAGSITKPGTYDLPVETSVVSGDMLIIRKSLSMVKVRFDNIISAKIPVEVNVSTKLGQTDYSYDTPTYSPQVISVVGPSTEVGSIAKASVVCKLDKIADVANETFGYTFINKKGETVDSSLLSADANEVAVSVRILQKKTVPIKLTLLNQVQGWTSEQLGLSLTPSEVTVIGPVSEIAKVDWIEVGPVDVSTLKGNDNFAFDIVLPKEVESADGISRVSAAFTLGGLTTTSVSVPEVAVLNNADGKKITVDGLPLSLTVRGTPEAIASLTPDSIQVSVDAGVIPSAPGTYTINAAVGFGNTTSVGVVGNVPVQVTVAS